MSPRRRPLSFSLRPKNLNSPFRDEKYIIPVKNLIFFFLYSPSLLPLFLQKYLRQRSRVLYYQRKLEERRRRYDNSIIIIIIILIDQIETRFFARINTDKISRYRLRFERSNGFERERASLESLLPRELNLPRFIASIFTQPRDVLSEINESLLPRGHVHVGLVVALDAANNARVASYSSPAPPFSMFRPPRVSNLISPLSRFSSARNTQKRHSFRVKKPAELRKFVR